MSNQIQELTKARSDLAKAINYLHALADTIPHNATLNRHIATLSGINVKLTSIETLREYGA